MSSPSKEHEEPSSSSEAMEAEPSSSAEASDARPPAKRRISSTVIEISDTESDDSDVCAVNSYQASADEVKRIRGDAETSSSSSSSSDYSSDSESSWEDDSVVVDDDKMCGKAVRTQLNPRAPRMEDPKLNAQFQSEELIEKLRAHWKEQKDFSSPEVTLTSEPFRLCLLHDLLTNEDFINNIVDDMNTLDWSRKKMDLYEFHQTADLASLTWQRSIRGIYELLKTEVMPWVCSVTGLELVSVSASCSLYGPGDHLLVHDDLLGDRRVAFILYLAPWRPPAPAEPAPALENGAAGDHVTQYQWRGAGRGARLGGAHGRRAGAAGARRPRAAGARAAPGLPRQQHAGLLQSRRRLLPPGGRGGVPGAAAAVHQRLVPRARARGGAPAGAPRGAAAPRAHRAAQRSGAAEPVGGGDLHVPAQPAADPGADGAGQRGLPAELLPGAEVSRASRRAQGSSGAVGGGRAGRRAAALAPGGGLARRPGGAAPRRRAAAPGLQRRLRAPAGRLHRPGHHRPLVPGAAALGPRRLHAAAAALGVQRRAAGGRGVPGRAGARAVGRRHVLRGARGGGRGGAGVGAARAQRAEPRVLRRGRRRLHQVREPHHAAPRRVLLPAGLHLRRVTAASRPEGCLSPPTVRWTPNVKGSSGCVRSMHLCRAGYVIYASPARALAAPV